MTVLVAVMPAPALAQAAAANSSVVGTVTDESGAAVPGVTVTLVNVGTQQKRTVQTNDRGDYLVTLLDLGVYNVSAEMAGFRTAEATAIRLQIGQVYRQNLILQVGQVTERVTVQANVVTVQTDDSTISTMIDEAKIRQLPIPADRNLFRLALLAPGMSRGPASSVTTGGYGMGFGIAASGQKVHNNNIILDGAPLRTAIHGATRMRPSVEAIQEFRIESGWYSAEYGTQSGAQIISTIRPGTNEFHGVLFHFMRNDKLDARNFFENPVNPKNPLRRNIFGGVLSGPIIKNKTFFTFNAEFLRERRTGHDFAIYPSRRMKQGDLTEPFFRNPDGSLKPIKDPTTGQVFPNNQIPAARISPIAKNFFGFWPEPNFGNPEYNGQYNFSGDTKSQIDDDQYFVRVDHTFGGKDKLFGRLAYQNVTPLSKSLQTQYADKRFTYYNPRRQRNATINWTHFLSATVLNEFKVAYNRDAYNFHSGFSGTDFSILRDLGIPGQTDIPEDTGPSGVSIENCCSVGRSDPNTIWDESQLIANHLSVMRGNHSLKFGSEFTRLRTDRRTVSFVNGEFTFDGAHSGIPWADFLLDQPRRIRLGFIPGGGGNAGSFPAFRYWRWHSYITDDWKLTPRLTMNIGLRYEYNSVFKDKHGQSRNFDFRTQKLFPEPGQVAGLHDPAYRNFAPRIGFAWRPFGGTGMVVRTGYGIFYNVNMINNFSPILAANPPSTLRVEELNLPGKPVLRMQNADQASNLLIQSSVSGAPMDHVVGMVQQWHLNIQKALPHNMLVEIGYTGSKSDHFDNVWERNPYIPGTTRRPIADLSSIEVQDNAASGNYHGLLTKLERQFATGFTFIQTYTWSKTMFTSFACCGAQRVSNPYDGRKGERGLAETDQRHRTTSAWLYELPWYRGRRDLLGQVLGNWQVNGVLMLETGMPFHPLQTSKPVEDGCPRCNPRPDRIADGRLSSDQRTLDRWFDTDAFRLAIGHYGTAGRDILSAPGLVNLDFSVFKNIPITERKRIQLRWEMYNATNTPPFNPPDSSIQSGNFGRIRSAGSGREMQFGLRFEF